MNRELPSATKSKVWQKQVMVMTSAMMSKLGNSRHQADRQPPANAVAIQSSHKNDLRTIYQQHRNGNVSSD